MALIRASVSAMPRVPYSITRSDGALTERRRVEALRYDARYADLEGMLEHHRTIMLGVLVRAADRPSTRVLYRDNPHGIVHPTPLPLSDWHQAVVFQPASGAALHIARKYRLLPHIAATVADLAGLGSGGER